MDSSSYFWYDDDDDDDKTKYIYILNYHKENG